MAAHVASFSAGRRLGLILSQGCSVKTENKIGGGAGAVFDTGIAQHEGKVARICLLGAEIIGGADAERLSQQRLIFFQQTPAHGPVEALGQRVAFTASANRRTEAFSAVFCVS
jgi:hypothetical protein